MTRLRFQDPDLDDTDRRILRLLTENARTSKAELARHIGLSAPSAAERVRRLEETGIIRGYTANIDPRALGFPISVYLRIRPVPGEYQRVVKTLIGLEAVVECDRVTGEDCFIAKAHLRTIADLEKLIDELVPYAMTNTSLVQSSPVPYRLPPIPD